ncbi:MAG: PAS and ANTAR domain-containing protein [Nocardioidaceae bacterium]
MAEPSPVEGVFGGSYLLVGHCHFDVVSDCWDWSDELYRLHGYQPGEVEPTTELLLSHKHPKDREQAERTINQALLDGEPFSSYHRFVTKDGAVKNIVAVCAGVVDEQGSVAALDAFMIDLTSDVQRQEETAADQAVAAATEHRAVIEQAKGMVMLTYNLDDRAAFELLRYWSMSSNMKLHLLARRLVEAAANQSVVGEVAKVRVDRLVQQIAAHPDG